MSIKNDINTDIETVLVSNAPFEYAHLIKFERPIAPDSIGFRTNANRYAYLTDASRDISFDDGSTDQDGNANGAQIYRANRVKSLGSYSETIQAKSTTMNLVLNPMLSGAFGLSNLIRWAYSNGAFDTNTVSISVFISFLIDIRVEPPQDLVKIGISY